MSSAKVTGKGSSAQMSNKQFIAVASVATVILGGALLYTKLLRPKGTPSEQLFRRLNDSIQKLESDGVVTATEKRLRQDLHDNKELASYEPNCILASATYLVFVSAQSSVTAQQEAMDMERAWELVSSLDDDALDGDQIIARDLMLIDIAYRLQHGVRLLEVFNRIYHRGDKMREEELLCCLEVACVLGQWKAMRFIGDYLTKSQNPLFVEQFVPDTPSNSNDSFTQGAKDFLYFKSVYNLAEREPQMQEDSEVEVLRWASFRVVSMETRLNECINFAPGEEAEAREKFDPEGNRAWKPAEGFDNILEITGALAKMQSMSQVTVAGPVSADSILLQGSKCTQLNGELVRRTERWELQPDVSDASGETWIGVMTISFEGSYGGIDEPFLEAPTPGERSVEEVKSPPSSSFSPSAESGEHTVTDSTATFDLRIRMQPEE